jgi:hypothetical protein
VGNSGRHIHHRSAFAVKRHELVLTIGRGIRSEIQDYIQHLALQAGYQLMLLGGRQLDMQSP